MRCCLVFGIFFLHLGVFQNFGTSNLWFLCTKRPTQTITYGWSLLDSKIIALKWVSNMMTFDRILTTAWSRYIYIYIHCKSLQCVALLTYALGLCAMDFNPYDVYLVVLTQRCLSHMAYPTFVAPLHRRVVRCWQRRPRSLPNQGGQPKDPQIEIWFLHVFFLQ